jgi:hypothetical protein
VQVQLFQNLEEKSACNAPNGIVRKSTRNCKYGSKLTVNVEVKPGTIFVVGRAIEEGDDTLVPTLIALLDVG